MLYKQFFFYRLTVFKGSRYTTRKSPFSYKISYKKISTKSSNRAWGIGLRPIDSFSTKIINNMLFKCHFLNSSLQRRCFLQQRGKMIWSNCAYGGIELRSIAPSNFCLGGSRFARSNRKYIQKSQSTFRFSFKGFSKLLERTPIEQKFGGSIFDRSILSKNFGILLRYPTIRGIGLRPIARTFGLDKNEIEGYENKTTALIKKSSISYTTSTKRHLTSALREHLEKNNQIREAQFDHFVYRKNLPNCIYNLRLPDLIDIQRQSFLHFLQKGLIAELNKRNPIQSLHGDLEFIFYPSFYKMNPPEWNIKQSILQSKTYACRLYVPAQLINKQTKQNQLQYVLLANLPIMTKRGHFIINGSPRIVINQMVRSPGIYFYQTTDDKKNRKYYADLISYRGTWLRLELDKRKKIWARMKKTPKISIFIFLQALGLTLPMIFKSIPFGECSEIHTTFLKNIFNDEEENSEHGKHPISNITALKQLYLITHPKKKVHEISSQKGKKFLFQSFLNNRTYDLSFLGRRRLNEKLRLNIPLNQTTLTAHDVLFSTSYLINLSAGIGEEDDIDHLKNRRIRTSGELIQNQLSIGLIRLEKRIREKFKEAQTENKQIRLLSDFEAISPNSWSLIDQSKINPPGLSPKNKANLTTKEKKTNPVGVDFDNGFVFVNQKVLNSNQQKTIIQHSLAVNNSFREVISPEIREDFASLNQSIQESPLDRSKIDPPQERNYDSSNERSEFPKMNFGNLGELLRSSEARSPQAQLISPNRSVGTLSNIKNKVFQIQWFKDEILTNKKHIDRRVFSSSDGSKETNIKNLSIRQLISTKPINTTLREFFGTNPLSQFMDQTNPLSEITHKRRLSSLGPGGVNRDTAGMAIRGIHPTHYGRICPIETPEGKNAGLVNSLTTYARVSLQGFISTPFLKIQKGQVQKKLGSFFFFAEQEEKINRTPGDIKINTVNFIPKYPLPTRKGNEFKRMNRRQINYIGISPIQMISLATSLIPFLEHDDGNRALMGSNMQRQAVPLIRPERPIVATGLEDRVVSDSGHLIQAKKSGFVSYVSSEKIIIQSLSDVCQSTNDPTMRFPNLKQLREGREAKFQQQPFGKSIFDRSNPKKFTLGEWRFVPLDINNQLMWNQASLDSTEARSPRNQQWSHKSTFQPMDRKSILSNDLIGEAVRSSIDPPDCLSTKWTSDTTNFLRSIPKNSPKSFGLISYPTTDRSKINPPEIGSDYSRNFRFSHSVNSFPVESSEARFHIDRSKIDPPNDAFWCLFHDQLKKNYTLVNQSSPTTLSQKLKIRYFNFIIKLNSNRVSLDSPNNFSLIGRSEILPSEAQFTKLIEKNDDRSKIDLGDWASPNLPDLNFLWSMNLMKQLIRLISDQSPQNQFSQINQVRLKEPNCAQSDRSKIDPPDQKKDTQRNIFNSTKRNSASLHFLNRSRISFFLKLGELRFAQVVRKYALIRPLKFNFKLINEQLAAIDPLIETNYPRTIPPIERNEIPAKKTQLLHNKSLNEKFWFSVLLGEYVPSSSEHWGDRAKLDRLNSIFLNTVSGDSLESQALSQLIENPSQKSILSSEIRSIEAQLPKTSYNQSQSASFCQQTTNKYKDKLFWDLKFFPINCEKGSLKKVNAASRESSEARFPSNWTHHFLFDRQSIDRSSIDPPKNPKLSISIAFVMQKAKKPFHYLFSTKTNRSKLDSPNEQSAFLNQISLGKEFQSREKQLLKKLSLAQWNLNEQISRSSIPSTKINLNKPIDLRSTPPIERSSIPPKQLRQLIEDQSPQTKSSQFHPPDKSPQPQESENKFNSCNYINKTFKYFYCFSYSINSFAYSLPNIDWLNNQYMYSSTIDTHFSDLLSVKHFLKLNQNCFSFQAKMYRLDRLQIPLTRFDKPYFVPLSQNLQDTQSFKKLSSCGIERSSIPQQSVKHIENGSIFDFPFLWEVNNQLLVNRAKLDYPEAQFPQKNSPQDSIQSSEARFPEQHKFFIPKLTICLQRRPLISFYTVFESFFDVLIKQVYQIQNKKTLQVRLQLSQALMRKFTHELRCLSPLDFLRLSEAGISRLTQKTSNQLSERMEAQSPQVELKQPLRQTNLFNNQKNSQLVELSEAQLGELSCAQFTKVLFFNRKSQIQFLKNKQTKSFKKINEIQIMDFTNPIERSEIPPAKHNFQTRSKTSPISRSEIFPIQFSEDQFSEALFPQLTQNNVGDWASPNPGDRSSIDLQNLFSKLSELRQFMQEQSPQSSEAKSPQKQYEPSEFLSIEPIDFRTIFPIEGRDISPSEFSNEILTNEPIDLRSIMPPLDGRENPPSQLTSENRAETTFLIKPNLDVCIQIKNKKTYKKLPFQRNIYGKNFVFQLTNSYQVPIKPESNLGDQSSIDRTKENSINPGDRSSIDRGDLASLDLVNLSNSIDKGSANANLGDRATLDRNNTFYNENLIIKKPKMLPLKTLKPIKYDLQNYFRSNQDTYLVHRPAVHEGDWVQEGDVLADSSASVGGELSIGQNILVAYMPWEGFNFEDAILISERLVFDDVYTSLHIEKYEIEVRETKFGMEQITKQIPEESKIFHLDNNGIVKLGTWIKEGDILVGKVAPMNQKPLSPHEKLLYDVVGKTIPTTRDTSLRVPRGVEGKVIHIEIIENEKISSGGLIKEKSENLFEGPCRVQIYIAEKRKIHVGDKMAGRHGNKGIVSCILPIQDMPYLPDGTPIDMVLNPLGVPSRMNVGQIFECLLGLSGKYLGQNFRIRPFDELYGPEASRSLVYSKLYETRLKTGLSWLFNPDFPGKAKIFDGRTGECFSQPVTIGQAYILKLIHLVDEKIHARSTGPYSLITQQPLRGRSKHGGQRLGEMEVWALEGFGAAFTLQELLTVKSDDMKGRHKVMNSILTTDKFSFGTPESFKVLIRELQALCLDIGIYSIDSSGKRKQIDFLKLT